MLVYLRGAGDIASGTALRLFNSGIQVVMADLPHPTVIRRTVSFAPAILNKTATVEGVTAEFACGVEEVPDILKRGRIPILADPMAASIPILRPDAVVDAILAKRNMGTALSMAQVVVALGPGFQAGADCHAVVETNRGHDLGRVLYEGQAKPNTGIPGIIGGYREERVLRAPCAGIFRTSKEIGDMVAPGDVIATVDAQPIVAAIGGVIRGLLEDGTPVSANMKSGDVDPRGRAEYCYYVSDKARAIAGGVLEAILNLSGAFKGDTMEDIKLTKLASCAGCGAKVGAGTLAKLLSGLQVRTDPNLLVGFDKSDDASVYRLSDELAIVQTLDFFPPIVDDPYLFGKIAATNALSDVYAMGGEPKLAMNILCVPEDMDKLAVQALLRGGYDQTYEAGAIITGGHSIFDPEPKYGLSVTGFVNPSRVLTNSGARAGDVLLFTKPLGIGIYTTAAKAGQLSGEGEAAMIELMTTLNKSARDCMVKYRVHACTDVTGFGFLGHLYEMAAGSSLTAHIDTSAVAILPEALSYARMGLLPAGMYRNRTYAEMAVKPGQTPLEVQDALYDPQTSGGLLIAVDPADANALYDELSQCVPKAQRVGVFAPATGRAEIILE